MVSTSTLTISDLSRQKKYTTDLSHELTPEHIVEQVIDHYLQAKAIPRNGLRWTAVSRGRRLDSKLKLAELQELDSDWRVLPEVTAGVA